MEGRGGKDYGEGVEGKREWEREGKGRSWGE